MCFEFVFNLVSKLTILTGQSWCILKSWYTGGSLEEGFWCCFADRFSQNLTSLCGAGYIHPGKRCKEWGINKKWIKSTPITQLCGYRCWSHPGCGWPDHKKHSLPQVLWFRPLTAVSQMSFLLQLKSEKTTGGKILEKHQLL